MIVELIHGNHFPVASQHPNQVISNPTDDKFVEEIKLIFLIEVLIFIKVKCFNLMKNKFCDTFPSSTYAFNFIIDVGIF